MIRVICDAGVRKDTYSKYELKHIKEEYNDNQLTEAIKSYFEYFYDTKENATSPKYLGIYLNGKNISKQVREGKIK